MSAPESPVMSVRHVSKRYTKYEDTPMLVTRVARLRSKTKRTKIDALTDVSFEIGRGECVGVIGHNGSGKSTLLRLLAGVSAPTEGRVAVEGRVAPLIAVGVGFHPELTGRENVYVNGTILGMSRSQVDARFDEIVDFAEIDDFIDTPVKFYSSGMFVRLGFAASIVADPDVLLVDEVLAVGDVRFQMRCIDRMLQIQESGATIVIVSHNLNAIRNMTKRTLVLHHGALRHDGPTADAISLHHELIGEAREPESRTGRAGAVDPNGPTRSGPQAAIVERFDLFGPDGTPTRHTELGGELTVELVVVAHRAVAQPLLGIVVINDAGVHVYSDSTDWDGSTVGPLEPGDVVECRATIRPALATGTYTIQLGLVDSGGEPLTAPVRPIGFYVGGRSRVQGVADLAAAFSVTRLSRAPAPAEPGAP